MEGDMLLDRKQTEEMIVGEVVKLLEEERNEQVQVALHDGLVDLGMDSLTFAVLVTRLEEVLGLDPFLALEDEVFPRTVAELVDVYVGYRPLGTS